MGNAIRNDGTKVDAFPLRRMFGGVAADLQSDAA